MVDWGSFLRLIGTIGVILTEQKFSTREDSWSKVGSNSYLLVISSLSDSVEVRVTAPVIDSTIRNLGKVGSGWTVLRLPYADTKVYVDVSGKVTVIKIDKPGFYPIKL